MQYRKYTNSSIQVSEFGLGAWQLGENAGWRNMSEQEAINMVHHSLDVGINFFDTAPIYGLGSSESRLGKALKSIPRDQFVINTKFGHGVSGETDFSAGSIRKSLEGSLRRLKLDVIDSLIIHNPPLDMLDGNKNNQYELLENLVKEGKIKAYGASLDTYEEMKLFMETTNGKVIEAFFNILHQDAARAFEMAQAQEVAIIVKIPLDSGWLSGKYNARSSFADVRARWTKQDIATRAQLVERVKEIIGPETQLSHAALSFCLAYDAVSTIIPGNTSLSQLNDNLKCLENPLDQQTIKKLEAFYEKEVRHLHLPW